MMLLIFAVVLAVPSPKSYQIQLSNTFYECQCEACPNLFNQGALSCDIAIPECKCFIESCSCLKLSNVAKRCSVEEQDQLMVDALIQFKKMSTDLENEPSPFNPVLSKHDNILYKINDNPLLTVDNELRTKLNDLFDVNLGVKADLPETKYSATNEEIIWNERMWTASFQLKEMFTSNTASDISFKSLLEMIGPWRNWMKVISIKQHDPLSEGISKFGVIRTLMDHQNDVAITPIESYGKINIFPDTAQENGWMTAGEYFKHLKENIATAGDTIAEEPIYGFKVKEDNTMYNMMMKEKTLSMVMFEDVDLQLRVFGKNIFRYQEGWAVSNSNGNMLKYFDQVLRDMITNSHMDDLKTFSKKVATMHWMIANSSPFKRGSASLADLLTTSMFLLKGLQFQGWKTGVSADVSALCISLEKFQNIFLDLMDAPPKPSAV